MTHESIKSQEIMILALRYLHMKHREVSLVTLIARYSLKEAQYFQRNTPKQILIIKMQSHFHC